MEKVVLLDSNSLIHRAYHALPNLTNSKGQATGAIYGFLNILLSLIKKEHPTHIAAAFDLHAPTFRHKMFESYKGTRKPMDDALREQIEPMKKLLTLLGIKVVSKEGYEADDVLGTLAKRFDSDTIIVTGDRDSFQLASPTTRIFWTKRGISDIEEITLQKLADMGFTPESFIDYKALRGDTSDNIPGVAGVGEKTAMLWLEKYKSLDGVFEHANEIGGKVGETLRNSEDIARLSKVLATIDCDAPIDCTLNEIEFNDVFSQDAKRYLLELEMTSVLSRMKFESKDKEGDDGANEVGGAVGNGKGSGNFGANGSLSLSTDGVELTVDKNAEELPFGGFESVENDEAKPLKTKYIPPKTLAKSLFESGEKESGWDDIPAPQVIYVKSKAELEEAFAKNKSKDEIAVCIGEKISFAYDLLSYFEIDTAEDLFSTSMNFDEALGLLSLECSAKRIVAFDLKTLNRKYSIKSEQGFDVMIAAHLARGSSPIKDEEALLGSERLEVNPCSILRMEQKLKKSLSEQGLDNLYYDVELPLSSVLGNMEERGFSVEISELDELEKKYTKQRDELTEDIFKSVGFEFNIASPKQLAEVLFERLQLKNGKKNKTGYSVSEDVLQNLVEEHPVVGMVLEWRHVSKLLSTYVTGLKPLVSHGKIHTEFNQAITTTGRLSSTNPNLQNIPVRSVEAKDIKSAFVGTDGNLLVSADYSQIELRLLAHLSGDEGLIAQYKNARDIHTATAAEIFGVRPEDVTANMRRDAKAVNFGIVYGMSDFGLATNLSIPKYKAKEFIERYFATYPAVKNYLDNNVEFARENGYAETMFGRRRRLDDINSPNYLIRNSSERMAKNTPLQGSAADIVKKAMLRVESALSGLKSKMILQVHDELIVDTAPDEVEAVKNILVEGMEHAVELSVPLTVGVGVGKNWGELK